MSYLYSKGKRILGDIIGADDSDRDTKINFEEDQIAFETNGTTRLKISGSSGAITFNEAFTFPTSDGNNKQVLSTNGSGVVTWTDSTGGGQLSATSDSKTLVAHLSSDFAYNTSGANEFQTVPFNNLLKNTFAGSDFNTSNYTFTAPEEGFYFINLSLFQQNINTDTDQYQVRISSSAAWAESYGAIAFKGYLPAGAAENNVYTHRLDRVAHLSGSDEVKITFRNVRSSTESGTSLHSGKHLTYLTIQKLEYLKREEVVVTGSSSIALDTTYNGGTVIITPLSSDITYTLPNPEPNFKVKFLAGTNLDSNNIIFKTKQSSSKIFGMLYRVSAGGDSETGYDTSPLSYAGAGNADFAGGASEVHKNTITIDNALQGTDIDFYSDGVHWYVRGTVVAGAANSGIPATITFSYGSY